MIQFLKNQTIRLLAGLFLATVFLASSIGCKAIYTDDVDVENAFRKDSTFDWVGTTRPEEDENDHFGYSPKARAIEKHMGIQ